MGFSERTHAFIAANFYEELTKTFGERGRKAFVHATQYMAGQRGRRMAQRAIGDGKELTYPVYSEYGEWVNTEEIKAEGKENLGEVKSTAGDYLYEVSRCPWHEQFKDMGLPDAGHEYCAHLDNSICRGFNPYITYLVPETLHKGTKCTHLVKDAGMEQGAKPKHLEYLRSFEFQTANSYWAYNEVTAAIFKSEGEAVNQKVMQRFSEKYGKEMADTLASYRWHNFNVAD